MTKDNPRLQSSHQEKRKLLPTLGEIEQEANQEGKRNSTQNSGFINSWKKDKKEIEEQKESRQRGQERKKIIDKKDGKEQKEGKERKRRKRKREERRKQRRRKERKKDQKKKEKKKQAEASKKEEKGKEKTAEQLAKKHRASLIELTNHFYTVIPLQDQTKLPLIDNEVIHESLVTLLNVTNQQNKPKKKAAKVEETK